MKDETKEILDYLNKFINDKEEITKYGCEISVKNAKALLDYINNLQGELKGTADLCSKYFVKIQALKEEITRLHNIINKTIELLKQAGSYDEETKQFCDDVWEELPNILNILEGSNK